MSTRNISWRGRVYRRPVRKADNLTTFMWKLSRNHGASNSWNPRGLCRYCFTFAFYSFSFRFACYRRDRLCGLVVRVSGYRYRGLGFDPRRYQIFWVVVSLERGPLSLVRSTEELLE
jgi:hypothetical protein